MTRQYATFDCGMWDDPNGFSALSAGAQRTYFMLVTQRDIAACGTLPLTLRRWSRTCSDKDVELWLRELVEQRYLIIDADTEEVLVRTFAKWDGGYKHAKRVQAVIASALAIRSDMLRAAAVAELRTLGVSIGNREAIDSLRSVVNEVSTNHTPETTLLGGEPGASAAPPPMFCTRHPEGTEDACGPCGRRREAYAAWAQAKTASDLEAKRATAEARRNCSRCNDRGILEHPDTGKPLGRCTHEVEAIPLRPTANAIGVKP